jgi:hypothetical protein
MRLASRISNTILTRGLRISYRLGLKVELVLKGSGCLTPC